MAKVNNVQKIRVNTSRLINRAANNKTTLEKIAAETLTIIKERTIGGKQLDPSNLERQKNMVPLQPSTIKRRKALSRTNSTSPNYRANRSNLSFTGRLLNSLQYRLKRRGFSIFASGLHKPNIGANGNRLGKAVSNKTILEGQASLYGRVIVGLTRRELSRLVKLFKL